MWILETHLRFSCLQGKDFSTWVISLALDLKKKLIIYKSTWVLFLNYSFIIENLDKKVIIKKALDLYY